MRGERPIGAPAWLIWFAAAAAIPMVSRHPLYLSLAFIVIMVVHLTASGGSSAGRSWKLFAWIGSTVAILSIGFNLLTVHVGDRPFGRIPDAIPIAGGALTYNALVYGVSSALAISTLLFAAATFNSAVNHIELLRRLPGPFQRLGLSTAIAMSFIPQTIQAGSDIFDAQRARGVEMRSVRSARAFLVPLLGYGLDRAIQTSEALEVRGYGSAPASTTRSRLASARIAVWTILAAAIVVLVAFGFVLTAFIVAALGASMAAIGRFRTDGPRNAGSSASNRLDRPSATVAFSALFSLAMTGYALLAGDVLDYSPFPRLAWPRFNALVGFALLALLVPAVVARKPVR